jgi:hypothetical protein
MTPEQHDYFDRREYGAHPGWWIMPAAIIGAWALAGFVAWVLA